MEQAYLPGTVRQRIQELIKERKITQAELAAEIGMAESSLSRFLSEKQIKLGTSTSSRLRISWVYLLILSWGRQTSRNVATMILRNWACPTRRQWRYIQGQSIQMWSIAFWRVPNSRRLHE